MLELKNLKKAFDGKQVIDDLNLTFNKGEIVGIIGPSGCGKSTLLRVINMLESLDSGSVLLDGAAITSKNVLEMRKKIGFVFQSFNLFQNMNVLENVMTALINVKKMPKNEAKIKAEESLKLVGLSHKADSMPKNLSGGEKQRVAIARTLAMDPEVILFDEPTSALDPKNVREIIDLIANVISKDKIALVVTHEMYFLKNVTNRVIMLKNGKPVVDLGKEEFFKSEIPEIKDFMH
ncbi:MAG: amino acid ABC transporter ATP-binding protein [Alphaproteobacteria bacterium]|nr:amino acid ABC transporter ATP-binding protein [Alphaproteobacteria bacterium]OJV15346.1 MAG: hypothetical protein BGO27_02435 [Alphaproteobacteria bacterium 33-17]